jgi:tetratricopeptide (TPR) repeat protein
MKPLITILFCMVTFHYAKAQQDSISYYVQKGDESVSRGQILPAYQYYKQAVSFDDDDPKALRGMASTALELRYYVIARETYKKLLNVTPKDTALMRQLAELNLQTRQFQDAIMLVQQARALGSKAPMDHLAAKAHYELQQYGSCLENIERAWKRDSSDAQLPFMAARCYIEMSNYRRAAGCYEQALRLDPTNAKWMYEAAMTFSAIPDEPRAIEWFNKSLAAGHPRTPDFLENFANSYYGNKEFDKCIPLYVEALQNKPEDLELLFSLGEAYYYSGKIGDAISTWDRMLAIDPAQARAVYMMGVAHIKKGDENKGKNLCEKAIQMDPSLARLKEKRTGFGL